MHTPAARSPKPARLRHDVHCEPLHTRLLRAAVRWGGAEAALSLWKPKSVGLFEGECRNMRILLSGILLFALCSPAFAQDAGVVAQNFAWLGDNMRSLSHTLMTIGGVGLAIGLASQAFGRRQVNVANVPTFPRYMTSPQQYRFGSIVFVIFASGFFLLLVYEHKEVARVADLFGEGLAKNIIDAIKDDAAPYLLVVAAMCAVYLYCLKKEANWNPC